MMNEIIFFVVGLGIYSLIVLIVFYGEEKYKESIVRFNWYYDMGLYESVRIIYPDQAKKHLEGL